MPTLIQKGNTLPVCKSSSFILSLSHDLVDNDIEPIDVDLSLFLLDKNGKLLNRKSVIFYNSMNTKSECGSVIHEDCKIHLNLSTISNDIDRIAIIASVFESESNGQSFRSVQNLSVDIFNSKLKCVDAIFNLTNNYDESTIVLLEFYRFDCDWVLKAIGQGYCGGLPTLIKTYGLEAA